HLPRWHLPRWCVPRRRVGGRPGPEDSGSGPDDRRPGLVARAAGRAGRADRLGPRSGPGGGRAGHGHRPGRGGRRAGRGPQVRVDVELAVRLLVFPRVGLGALVESVLGWTLEKGHAAADWSVRPLPAELLRYAALDVELLVELRDALAAQLVAHGKTEWAEQEFAAVLAAKPPGPRPDPWRRTSGIHRVHSRRGLAIVRELWQ